MDRRRFLKSSIFAAGLIITPSISFAGEKLCLPGGIIYTKDRPGKWQGKEGSHVPVVKVEGDKITVVTRHPMTKRHYIVKHTIVSEDGKVLGEKVFYPKEKRAVSYFNIPKEYKGRLYVTSFCNLHDMWLKVISI